jgi:hypothetical protein
MYCHHLVLSIYEPLVSVRTNSFPTPLQVVQVAEKYLLTLVRLYFLRHGFEAMDLFIVIPLVFIAMRCLETIGQRGLSDEDLEITRSNLILVINGLYFQRRNHYLAETLYSVVRSSMRVEEKVLLKEALELDEQDEEQTNMMNQVVQSAWPVSIARTRDEMNERILSKLVEKVHLT